MIRFVLRRTAAAIVVLLVLSAAVFALQQISPGDPARASLGANASMAAVAAERQKLGLNDPALVQYWRYLSGIFHGNLGTSYRTHQAVTADLGAYLPATVELVLVAFAIALLLAGVFAFCGALRWPGGFVFRGVLLVGAAAPPFLLALGGIILFYAQLGWLPASGQGTGGLGSAAEHVLMPALVLSIAPAVGIGRILRAGLDAQLHADHVRTARSKGLSAAGVLARHVFRNAIGPGLSMAGLQLGFMFAGVVVVEQIFSWPGIGNYLAQSIPASDFPAIAGVTLVLGAIYVVTNAVVDILQALADPRITV